MSFPPVTQDPLAFGGVSYCSTGKMITPTGSPHVRVIEFRIPRLKVCPSVSHQIVGEKDASPLTVYALKINDNVAGMTQIVVEAQTLDGRPATGAHHCNIVAIETPQPMEEFNALKTEVHARKRFFAGAVEIGMGQAEVTFAADWKPSRVAVFPPATNSADRFGVGRFMLQSRGGAVYWFAEE